jgi:hypothetical protein
MSRRGVCGYAAYQFEADGQIVTLSVPDWVGAEPLDEGGLAAVNRIKNYFTDIGVWIAPRHPITLQYEHKD